MNIIYQDKNVLVIDKPAGISVDELEDHLPKLNVPRNGIVHRLDKETSGIILVARNNKVLSFFQKQFEQRGVEKKYLALVAGVIKENEGTIKTLIGRDKDGIRQKAYLPEGPESKKTGPRLAETDWKVSKRYKNYTLIEVRPKTGRKHQIRVHLAYIGHPIVGDKLYSFKNQPCPEGLKRQFLHASGIKIKLVNGKEKVFVSELPDELKQILNNL